MNEKDFNALAGLATSTQQLLTSVNATVQVLERMVVAMAASHPDKSEFLKALRTQMEAAIVTDLYGPLPPEVLSVFEAHRDRLLQQIRAACT